MRQEVYTGSSHTFVICAYERSRYLESCIRSLLGQSVKSKVCISTSTPNEFVEKLADKYGLPLYISSGETGLAPDWNFAYSCAETPLVTLAHQDDIYGRRYTERILEALNRCKHPLIAFTDYVELRDGQTISQNHLLTVKRLLLLPLRQPIFWGSVFVRRRILSLGSAICCPSVTMVRPNLPCPLFRNNMRSNIDWQAWAEISRWKGEFAYVPVPSVKHRIHGDSTTSELLRENERKNEDLTVYRMFWSDWIAQLLERFYQSSESSNRIGSKGTGKAWSEKNTQVGLSGSKKAGKEKNSEIHPSKMADKQGNECGKKTVDKRDTGTDKPGRVSVIIPVYNNESFVEKCVRSVMNQTYRELEIIVIDDGSTDGSAKVLSRLAKEDPRIILERQENSGVSVARNRGLQTATGEYLTFIDGDDYVSRDYVEKLLDCAKHKGARMVVCGICFVDEQGKVLRTLIPKEYVRFQKEEWVFRISAVCSHLYEKKLWDEYDVRFQPGERGEDMPISLFFSAICDKISTLPVAGYYYVQHADSAMHHLRGLKDVRLPYLGLETTAKKIQKIGIANSREFCELFVLRILATCYFDLARGASGKDYQELCNFIVHYLQTYFPGYRKNRLTRVFSRIDVPVFQKVAVRLLVFLTSRRLLYPFSRLLGRK